MRNQSDDDDIYYTSKTRPPEENLTFDQYLCESFVTQTNCSLIYSGRIINSDVLNDKVVFKFIKRIKKNSYRLDNEMEIINNVNHPYILKAERSFNYRQFGCIITKLAPYGTLYDVISSNKRGIREDLARTAMRQMLEAIKYLHRSGIWHRDIKPHNFLVYSWLPDPILVVLADFGFSRYFSDGELGCEFIGTHDYAAPEIYKHQLYTNSVDIWSLGITLFYMLTGTTPFPSYYRFPQESQEKIMRGIINAKILQENGNSIEVIDLIENMCQKNPDDRCTAEIALMHPWFKIPDKSSLIELQTRSHIISNEVID